MVVIVDAAPLVSGADARDPVGIRVAEFLLSDPGPFVLPAVVAAEVDYLIGERHGHLAQRRFLADLAEGHFQVECLEPGEYRTVLELARRYESLRPGLADLSVVVLAARFGTRRILTFDQRHFRAMTPLQGGAFTLLPDDA